MKSLVFRLHLILVSVSLPGFTGCLGSSIGSHSVSAHSGSCAGSHITSAETGHLTPLLLLNGWSLRSLLAGQLGMPTMFQPLEQLQMKKQPFLK